MAESEGSAAANGKWGSTIRQGFLNLTESKAVQRVVALALLTVLIAIVAVVLCLLPAEALGKLHSVVDVFVVPLASKMCGVAHLLQLDSICSGGD